MPQVGSHERGIWLRAVLKYLIVRETARSDATIALVTVRPDSIDGRLWSVRDTGTHPSNIACSVDLPESAALLLGDTVWQSFKRYCAANGNILPLLITGIKPKSTTNCRVSLSRWKCHVKHVIAFLHIEFPQRLLRHLWGPFSGNRSQYASFRSLRF